MGIIHSRFLAPVLILQVLLFATQQPASSPVQPPQRDPQALALLAQCSTAMGAQGTVPDIYAEGVITRANPNSPSATVVVKSKGTDRVRNEISLVDGQQIFVVNSGRGFSSVSGQRKNLPLHSTSYFRPEHLSAFACAIDLARANISVSYLGVDGTGAAPAHHLLFQSALPDRFEQLASEFHVYLDAKTLRVVKTASWVFAPDTFDNRSLWETYYDSYQPVGGVLFPMHMQHSLAGTHFDDWNFNNVKSDALILQSDFN